MSEILLYIYMLVIASIIGILIYSFVFRNIEKQCETFNSFIKKAAAAEVILLALSAGLAYGLKNNSLLHMDETVHSWIIMIRSEFMTSFMHTMSFFASSYFLPFAAVISFYFLASKLKNLWAGFILLINIVGANFVKIFIKNIFKRIRPEYAIIIEKEYSFPSGHSFIGFTFYTMLAYMIYKNYSGPWKRSIIIFLVVFPIIIAISRLYLGVHYASDVFAGILMGTSWLIFCIALYKYYEIRNS